MANALPWSLGKVFLHRLIATQVAAKAIKILINVTSFMYALSNNLKIITDLPF
jgi:hypothetical protein